MVRPGTHQRKPVVRPGNMPGPPSWICAPAPSTSAPVDILRGTPKRHFVDPSLAVAALGADPARLLADPETLGLLFESLVIRDLRIYAQTLGASVLHYRENTGLEADAVIQLREGRWAALEVKLGQHRVDQAAANLIRVAARVDSTRHGAPAFLAAITGWGDAHHRDDGVLLLPLGVLGA